MKRMNVLIDEKILSEVKTKLRSDSYSAAINEALKQTLRIVKIQDFARFAGSGIWEEDLNEMREDKKMKRKKKNKNDLS